MIQANVAAAETLEAKRSAADLPHPRRAVARRSWSRCASSWRSLGMTLPKGGSCCARPLQPHPRRRRRHASTEHLVNEVVLRSQSQAEYAAENIGHFGLNLRRYAHFTSPIRRYADLIVHRALISRAEARPGRPRRTKRRGELAEIAAQHLGRRAARHGGRARHRRPPDRHHLAERIGADFDGRISGVTRSGLFVQLDETGADGFVPAAHDRAPTITATTRRATPWSATRTGETFRLGDTVEVQLVEAAPVAGALRFEILSEGRSGQRGKDGARKPAAKGELKPNKEKAAAAKEDAWPRRRSGGRVKDRRRRAGA